MKNFTEIIFAIGPEYIPKKNQTNINLLVQLTLDIPNTRCIEFFYISIKFFSPLSI